MLIFLVVFLYSGYEVATYYLVPDDNEVVTGNVQKKIEKIKKSKNESSEIDFANLKIEETKKINKDALGQVIQKDTGIDHPILQTNNNSYYLTHNINKKYDFYGSVFSDTKIDYKKFKDGVPDNHVIYGHSMKNGRIFGQLKKLKKKDFFDKAGEIRVELKDVISKYEIIGVYLMDVDNPKHFYHFDDDLVWGENMNANKYLNNLEKIKMFRKDKVIKDDDKLVTLPTCSYEYEDSRFIVVGREYERIVKGKDGKDQILSLIHISEPTRRPG